MGGHGGGLDDPVQHSDQESQGAVAGQFDDEEVELRVDEQEPLVIVEGVLAAGQHLVEPREGIVVVLLGAHAGGTGLQQSPGLVDVGEGCAPVLQDRTRVPGGGVPGREVDARSAARTPSDTDQPLGLQDPEPLP